MVDSVSTASSSVAASTLLRAQTMGVNNLKADKQATQSIIDQLQKNNVASATPSMAGSNTLPRGSLLDITV